MRQWAPAQLRRLHQLHAMLPPGKLRKRASESAAVVRHADLRATALSTAVYRGCLAHSGSDQFGMKPCRGTGSTQHRHGSGPGKHGSHGPGPRHGSGGGTHPGGTGSSAPSTRPGRGRSGGSGPSSSPGPSLPSLPSLPIPSSSLPLPTSSVPISLGSCVSLPLGITVGNCPSS
jgi:hypothetical protein